MNLEHDVHIMAKLVSGIGLHVLIKVIRSLMQSMYNRQSTEPWMKELYIDEHAKWILFCMY